MKAFIIWTIVGLFFILLGLHSFTAKKAVGFWSNVQTPTINDVKSYNKSVGKLLTCFGIIFIITGLPLLLGQNSPGIIISILACFFECIGLMVVYTKILIKYGK